MEENTNKTNNKKIVIGILIAVILLAAIFAVIMLLNKSYRLIKVVETEGSVKVIRKSEELDAYVDMLLASEDTVTTATDSRLYLQLDDEKYVEVMPESKIHIIAKGKADKNNTKTTIVLEEGSVINEINTKLGEDETFDVDTPSVSMGVRGTKFKVVANVDEDGKKETYIEVTKGTVEAYREGESDTVKIDAGYNVTIKEDDRLADVTVEETLPYYEFSFDINDVRIMGKTIQEAHLDMELIDEIQNIVGATIYSKPGYDYNFSDGSKTSVGVYESENGDYSCEWTENRDWKYINGTAFNYITCSHDNFTSVCRYLRAGEENEEINKIVTPIMPDNIDTEKFYEIIHYKEMKEYAKEHGVETFEFMCNWSDSSFIFTEMDSESSHKVTMVNLTNNISVEFSHNKKNNRDRWFILYYPGI